MELVIPQWAVYLGGGLIPAFVGALIWVFLRQNAHGTKIAVISSQLEGIKESITNARVEFKFSFDKLEGKFDTFLAGELQFFKEQYKQKK